MLLLKVFGLSLIVQIIKKWIKPKFGDFGIHFVTFIIAGLVIGINMWAEHSIQIKELLMLAGAYLSTTIALYEVILKKIFDMVGEDDTLE